MSETPSADCNTVLLVEDNLADQEMARRALAQVKSPVRLMVVDDGEQALDYLLRRDVYQDPAESPPPDLILLDLNLPKLSGKELLLEVRSRADLKHLPIIILSTSQAEEDVLESYQMGCNAFITKPARFELFVSTMEHVTKHWFDVVRLPTKLT